MKLSENFSLSELTKSQTAERKGIDNTPSPTHQENLKSLCEMVLQPVRDHFSRVVTISSGYRSPEDPNSGWVHCSYTNGNNRKQYLRAYKEDGKTKYEPVL